MIIELKRLEGDYELYDSDLDDSFFINTKNIYSIEYYQDSDYSGLLINGKKHPLNDYDQSTRGTENAKDEAERELIIESNWEASANHIRNILHQIIEVMKKEDNGGK